MSVQEVRESPQAAPDFESADSPDIGSTKSRTAPAPAASGLYRVLWRWHFYAGLLIAPTLFAVAVTGAIYIYRSEIEDTYHATLRFVEPATGLERTGTQSQMELAQAALPGRVLIALEQSSDPRRASIARFSGPGREQVSSVYIDPYRSRVLGTLEPGDGDPISSFFDLVLKIHRELAAGITGRLVVELTTGWTIVLLITGLALWWPRDWSQGRGVWWPRWKGKLYAVLRDWHTVLGFYTLAPVLLIVVTGLFYTMVWGEGFHLVTSLGSGQAASAPSTKKAASDSGGQRGATPAGPQLSIDAAAAIAHGLYPDRNLLITPPKTGDREIRISASNDYNCTWGDYRSAQFAIDRHDGTVRNHTTLAENPRYWWHGWVYPLHVGSVLGPFSKAVWLVACLVLAALPVTGLWMWWVRRPSGQSGFPRRPQRALGSGLVAIIAGLSLALPVMGVSIILILVGELAVGWVSQWLAHPSPAA